MMKNREVLLLTGMLILMTAFSIAVTGFASANQGNFSKIKPRFIAESFWGTNTSPLVVYPGASYMPLTTELVYLGPANIYNVSIYFNSSYPLVLSKGQKQISLFLPEVSPGDRIRLFGYFNVSSSSHPGIYNETLTIVYYTMEAGKSIPIMVRGNETINTSIPILGYSDIKLMAFRTNPPVLYAGMKVASITLYLINKGNSPAVNVSVELETNHLISPLYNSSNKIFIAYLPPGTPFNITVPVKLANLTETKYLSYNGVLMKFSPPKGYNTTLALRINYTGGYENIPVSLQVYPTAHFAVVGVQHSRLFPGASKKYITITLANVGYANASFVTITLLPNPVFSPHTTSSENPLIAIERLNFTLGDVVSNGKANVTYVLDVSSGIKQGTYYLPLLVSWYQGPTMQEMHQIIEVPVKISPIFSLSSLGLSSSSAGSPMFILTFIAVIVVIILVAMAAIGSRRK